MENYSNYPDSAKVWVYQSNRVLDEDEIAYLKVQLDDFTSSWESHGKMLTATTEVFYNTFVVFFVDEEGDAMCGRAKDASVRLMVQLEEELENKFLDRMVQAYKVDDQVKIVHMNDFPELLTKNEIDENTMVFNNMITTKAQFDSQWELALKDSWHQQFLTINS
jgi:hypothetical protein